MPSSKGLIAGANHTYDPILWVCCINGNRGPVVKHGSSHSQNKIRHSAQLGSLPQVLSNHAPAVCRGALGVGVSTVGGQWRS